MEKKKKESMGALDFPLQDLELSVKVEGWVVGEGVWVICPETMLT